MREGVNGPVLEVSGLVKDYVSRDAKLQQRVTRAVDGVSFEVRPGETFAVVGESGSGKSTVGRVLLKLTDATEGEVRLLGEEILGLQERQFRGLRRRIQMVFQDPLAAFDPRASIRSSLREFAAVKAPGVGAAPKRASIRSKLREFAEFGGRRAEQNEAVDQAVRDVGLPPEIADRRPSQVSGGQLQRLSIARSLLVKPQLLFLDEPTSSLDVSIRGQIVNLLAEIQEREGISYLLVAHDLRVVYVMAHRVAVMYLGQFVEVGSRDQIYEQARHPYTRGLLDAALLDEPELAGSPVRLTGEISEEQMHKPGCRLTPRCPFAEERCEEPQQLRPAGGGRLVRCWKAVEQPVSIGLSAAGRPAGPAGRNSE